MDSADSARFKPEPEPPASGKLRFQVRYTITLELEAEDYRTAVEQADDILLKNRVSGISVHVHQIWPRVEDTSW